MKPYLIYVLVVPLTAVAAISMIASAWAQEPWKGLLVNMAATFLGSIVTVFYVDFFLTRHENRRWSAVRDRAEQSVERVANVCVSAIRTTLGVGPDEVMNQIGANADSSRRRQFMAGFAETSLKPLLPEICNVDVKGWHTLALNLQGASALADRALGIFGRQIDAPVMDAVLKIQEVAERIVGSYSTFPDIYGVPADRLPTKRDGSSSVSTQNGLYEMAVENLGDLLSECASLLRAITPR